MNTTQTNIRFTVISLKINITHRSLPSVRVVSVVYACQKKKKKKVQLFLFLKPLRINVYWVSFIHLWGGKNLTQTSVTITAVANGSSALRSMAAKLSTPRKLSSMPKNQTQVIFNDSLCHSFSLIPTTHHPGMSITKPFLLYENNFHCCSCLIA